MKCKTREEGKTIITGNSFNSDCHNCGRILRSSKELHLCEYCMNARAEGKRQALSVKLAELNKEGDRRYKEALADVEKIIDNVIKEHKVRRGQYRMVSVAYFKELKSSLEKLK